MHPRLLGTALPSDFGKGQNPRTRAVFPRPRAALPAARYAVLLSASPAWRRAPGAAARALLELLPRRSQRPGRRGTGPRRGAAMGRRGHAHCGAASRPAQLCQVCARRRRGGSRARGGTPPWGSSRRAGGPPPAERPGMAEPLRRTLSKLRGRRSPRGAAAGGAHRHGGGCGPQGKSPSARGAGGRVWRRSAPTCGAGRGVGPLGRGRGGARGAGAALLRENGTEASFSALRAPLRGAVGGAPCRVCPSRVRGAARRGAGGRRGVQVTKREPRGGRGGCAAQVGAGSGLRRALELHFFSRVCEDFAFVSSKSNAVLQVPTSVENRPSAGAFSQRRSFFSGQNSPFPREALAVRALPRAAHHAAVRCSSPHDRLSFSRICFLPVFLHSLMLTDRALTALPSRRSTAPLCAGRCAGWAGSGWLLQPRSCVFCWTVCGGTGTAVPRWPMT